MAQAFDSGAYGACAYQDTTNCSTSTQDVGAPNTGLFMQPTFMIPAIIGGAVLIAALILAIKKINRKVHNS